MASGCAQELQLLTNKQELETAVERWKAQAEAKGVHLDNPAGALCIPSLSRLRHSFQAKQGPASQQKAQAEAEGMHLDNPAGALGSFCDDKPKARMPSSGGRRRPRRRGRNSKIPSVL